MENNVCKDCGGTGDIYVKVISTNTEEEKYQCSDCYFEEHEKNKHDSHKWD